MPKTTDRLDRIYEHLKVVGEISGPERTVEAWLGCVPESLRKRAWADGLSLSITLTGRVKGRRTLTVALRQPS